jgi:hypothetical protein
MRQGILHTEIFGSVACFMPVLTSKKLAALLNCRVAFFISKNLHRESLGILPKLIILSLNQRRTIELVITTESACNDLTVLSCDLNNDLRVVCGRNNLC